MNKSMTNILAGVVMLLLAATLLASWRVSGARSAALSAQRDLITTRADLADLAAWHMTAAAGEGAADAGDVNRRIRAAASTIGLVDHVVSVEPGPTVRVRDTDTVRTPIYLRLEDVSLRQLVTFLAALTRGDAAARVTGIDLSAPPPPAARPGAAETWTADVTLSESAAAPAETR